MRIEPTLDRILVKLLEEEETVAGIEIVRDGKNAEMQTGVIEEAGKESGFNKGDKVLYNPASGTLLRILVDGKHQDYRMMLADTITAIVYD